MTLKRAVKLLVSGTVIVGVMGMCSLVYFQGLDGLSAYSIAVVFVFGYQLSAFIMTSILFPLYWYRTIKAALRVSYEVDSEKWAEIPVILRLNKFNAVFFPETLTLTGKRERDDFLFAVEGMLGVIALAGSLILLSSVGFDYFKFKP